MFHQNSPAEPSTRPSWSHATCRHWRGGRCWAWLAGGTLLAYVITAPAPAATVTNAAVKTPAKADHGYAYIHDEVPDMPWSIHIFKVKRGHPELELHTTSGRGATIGMSTVSQQIKYFPPDAGQPLAAINGDFYERDYLYNGRPRDVQIRQGELISGPSGHVCFWLDSKGAPRMAEIKSRFRVIWPNGATTPFELNGERSYDMVMLYTSVVGNSTHTSSGVEIVLERTTNSLWLPLQAGQQYVARVREVRNGGDAPLNQNIMVLSMASRTAARLPAVQPGAVIRIVTETTPSLTGVKTAIGGGPTLVRNGQAMEWGSFEMRHPRTALGFNQDSIFLVVVDGRQRGVSIGMTFSELSAYMRKLGCQEAMNMDGGGSTTLWVSGQVMNNPCEGRERPSANALVVAHKKNPPEAPSNPK